MTAPLLLALLALALWLGFSLLVRRHWPHEHVLGPSAGGALPGEVAAVVPARNEAGGLARNLAALLEGDGPLRRVVVVDDRSEDRTGTEARDAGHNAAVPLDVVRIERCPEGWAGKVHALQRGLDALAPHWKAPPSERWVLFTDADIRHPPDVVARLRSRAHAGGHDLVSVMARLRTQAFWERVLIPPFVWFFQALFPFRRSSDPGARTASAAGGVVLVRLATLEAAGGLAAWRGALIDDLALARGVKDAGGSLWCGFADDVVSTRAYPTLGAIADMVARSAFEQLGRRHLLVPLVWIGLLLLFVVPPAALVLGIFLDDLRLAAAGGAGWLLQLVHVLPAWRHHGLAAPWALAMPLAAVLYAWMTTLSAWRHARGRALAWRAAPEAASEDAPQDVPGGAPDVGSDAVREAAAPEEGGQGLCGAAPDAPPGDPEGDRPGDPGRNRPAPGG